MLDGIEMQRVGMLGKVLLVADAVLPESSLPDAAFSLQDAASGKSFFGRDTRREARLDVVPAGRKICIVWR